jgi:SAM-dependent methyltransferase
MTDRSNWFEHFFHGVANDCWRKCITPDQTRAEVDFLERVLGTKQRLLDAPCGNGRHALELARRGGRVTGLDLSREFIAEAKATAKSQKLKVKFVRGDMRRLPWKSEFDGAYCMGNSFGYFELPDTMTFLRGLARSLKPGAPFVIETGCVAESLLPQWKEREWFQVQDILFAIENRYLADISCLETNCTFVKNGRTESRKFWHHVYTVAEMRRLIGDAGLAVNELCSSYSGQHYRLGSPLLLMVGQKRKS